MSQKMIRIVDDDGEQAPLSDPLVFPMDIGTACPEDLGPVVTKESDSYVWLLAGILAGVCFGVGNMLIATTSHFGFYTRQLLLIGGFFLSVFCLIVRFIFIKYTTGNFWNWENSGFRNPDTNKFRWAALAAIFIDVTIKIIAGWLVITSFKYALYAGINQGAITTIFALSSVFVAILSWFIFDEKLSSFNIIGMVLLFGSTIMIVFSKTNHNKQKIKVFDDDVEEMPTYMPVILALFTTFLYSFRTVYVKLFVRNLNFSSIDLIIYSYLISGGIFIPFFFADLINNGIMLEVVILGLASGALNCIASLSLFYATSYGITGPAYALKNIEPIIQAV